MQIKVENFASTKRVALGKDSGYFPVIATTNGEDVLIVYRAGAGHMGIKGRLEAIRTVDGENWSEPVVIADSARDDRNPAIGVTKGGTIVVAYHVNGNYRGEKEYDPKLKNLNTYITSSRDGGITWETPYELNLELFDGLSPYGQMLTLDDGNLLMPIYGKKGFKSDEHPPAHNCSYLIRSTDNGLTWKEASLVGENVNETAFLMLPDGKILAVMRTPKDGHLSATFTDRLGQGWTAPVDVTRGDEYPGCLTLLSNGYILLSYGYRAKPYGARGLISKDSARTWIREKELIFGDKASNWDCGYPSTIRLKDGRLITAFYSTIGEKADAWSCRGAKCHLLIYREEELLQAIQK